MAKKNDARADAKIMMDKLKELVLQGDNIEKLKIKESLVTAWVLLYNSIGRSE